MANNATNVWRWIGKVSSEWTSAPAGVPLAYNWTNGDDVVVNDYPDSGTLDTVTMVSSADYALETCAIAIAVKTITQGASYLGNICVANLTATTVTAITNGGITGGTISILNASGDCSISGGTITTANLSGTATATDGTITTANCTGASLIAGATVTILNWNSTGAQAFGTFGATINAYQDLLFDGGNVTFDGTLTSINVMRRGVSVKFAFAVHTWAGKLTILAQYLYGMGEAGGMLDA